MPMYIVHVGTCGLDSVVNKIFTYLQNYMDRDPNLVILKRKLEELNGVKEDKQSMTSVEELNPRKKIKKSVHTWFLRVEMINETIMNDLENGVTRSNDIPFVGEKVLNRIEEVDRLLVQGKSFDDLVIDDTQWIGPVLSTTTLFGEVPKKIMEEIWEYLLDDRVSKIGVCGIGGIGKTTIVKRIHNQLVKEIRNFTKVIWVTVSKEINITRLQNNIAHLINESFFEEDDETTRAGKLYKWLVNLGKYVLILDDLWDTFSLEELGIPNHSNGSKLVITTRSLDVCHYFNCQEVRIPNLMQSDAWSLFLEKVGLDVLNFPYLLPLVRSVVDKCDGLPLAIVTIASSMRGVRDTYTWRNALHELERQIKSVSGVNGKIFEILKFSYGRLGDEKLKLCFLCCALYPENRPIRTDELINLWIAEGYVEEMNSMQAEIERGYAILNKLKNYHLIGDGYNEYTVTLHDVVRDMALYITRPSFLVRADMPLLNIRDVMEEWKENWEKISLMRNSFLDFPSQIMSLPNCPVLTTLLLSNCKIKSIPECFFEQMPRLRILDLSRNKHLESLPNSISNLERLTTLLLGGCNALAVMPSLSRLKDLKKLDLYETSIKEVPHGIDERMKLRYVDLSFTSIREMNVGLILATWTSLLYLNVSNFGREIESGGMAGIKLLTKLEFLKGMCFNELGEFNSYAQFVEDRVGREVEWHHHYNIVVGDINKVILHTEEKSIGFSKCVLGAENIKLPSDVEELVFEDVINGHEEEEILSNLFCGGNARLLFLKKISYCAPKNMKRNIKKLFSFDWASHNLQKLEELTIEFDYGRREESLEEIIGSESEYDEGTIKLSGLLKLELLDLPELKRICSEKVSLQCDCIEEIIIRYCPYLKRIPLNFPLGKDGLPSPPQSLEYIEVDSKEWWESAEWDQPQAKSTVEHLVKYCLEDEVADTDSSETSEVSDTDSSETSVVSDTDRT